MVSYPFQAILNIFSKKNQKNFQVNFFSKSKKFLSQFFSNIFQKPVSYPFQAILNIFSQKNFLENF